MRKWRAVGSAASGGWLGAMAFKGLRLQIVSFTNLSAKRYTWASGFFGGGAAGDSS
jgi:hypothetical protein